MENAPDRKAIESAVEQRDYLTVRLLADIIKSRLQSGQIVGALDYPESDRPQFWAAIARVRDDLPCVRSTWRTINEQHVDGIRTRQKLFKIFPRQRVGVDPAPGFLDDRGSG